MRGIAGRAAHCNGLRRNWILQKPGSVINLKSFLAGIGLVFSGRSGL